MPSSSRASRVAARVRRPGSATPAPATRGARDFAARLRDGSAGLAARLERPDTLVEIGRAVGATIDPGEIASIVVARVASWLPVKSWMVLAVDMSGRLSRLASRGLDAAMESGLAPIARQVVEHGEWVASADLARDPRSVGAPEGSVLAIPLLSRGAVVAALLAAEARPSGSAPGLEPAARRALQILLEPAATALDKALLLQRAEALSVTDDLTHLNNSRYLNQALRRETKRAARGGQPLSLLFIDLDGFKRINDSHGHLAGSRALVEAAKVIREGARETDIVARFGGDEFALVLPDTGSAGARAVAERIRERIARHDFLASEGLRIHLTVSVGMATLPDVAGSADELVQAADAAMYQVKARGKNGVQAAVSPADT